MAREMELVKNVYGVRVSSAETLIGRIPYAVSRDLNALGCAHELAKKGRPK
jgi:hypothetical protein